MDTTTESPGNPPESNGGQPSDQELFRVAAETAAKHGAGEPGGSPAAGGVPPKRKPGRPTTHGRYSKAAGSDGKSPVPLTGRQEAPFEDSPAEVESNSPPRPGIPPDLLARFTVSACKLAENGAGSYLKSKAAASKLAGPEVSSLIESAEMGEEQRKLIGELAPYSAAELGFDPAVSPTACIGIMLTFWGAGIFRAAMALEHAAKVQANPSPSTNAA